jgi:hypothetical protein
MAAEAGAPRGQDGKTMAVLMAAQKAALASPTAVEAWAPPERDREEMAALTKPSGEGKPCIAA